MIKIFAVICSLASPDTCIQHTITNSDFADLKMSDCIAGEPKVVGWLLSEHPGYSLKRWSCQLGERPDRRAT